VPFGYWEAKDTKDDLDAEIEKKFKRGYPQDNIIFDDTVTAVLIQNKREVIRVSVEDVEQLSKLLKLFFSYERVEISQFNKAVGQFKQDLPAVLAALREMIEAAYKSNKKFVTESQQRSTNPTKTVYTKSLSTNRKKSCQFSFRHRKTLGHTNGYNSNSFARQSERIENFGETFYHT
jgi:hypothetical protein